MSGIGMQLAIQRTDQCKLFPVIVLLQNARLSYASHCAILGCFAQIRTASVLQAAGQLPNSPSSAHNGRGALSIGSVPRSKVAESNTRFRKGMRTAEMINEN